ncbi:hypothetical protein SAMN05878503_10265 [Cereibacter ovatus]|uniref:Uncharacterized protein n=1 Tax=Cereibacter ovatus TaxID=439529 RepID=A0A285CMU3_9RHOB|nr:hypothetical protein [Cereibacter ovatus]SNX68323.1 hypothetical protein SAMN05878503_10265 [Cereibacter ovatus]
MMRLTLTVATVLALGLAAPAFSYPFDIPHLTWPTGQDCTAGTSCPR